MFTGIVTAVGRIERIEPGPVHRFWVSSSYPVESFEIGCSVAHAGACLTVVEVEPHGDGAMHLVELSPETLDRTSLGDWVEGTSVNLERSLKVGDELGGHIVQGHVDGVGEIADRIDADGWVTFRVKAPAGLAAFIAEKGSIAVDGVSLTVNGVAGDVFDLMIIPHTADVTTLGQLKPGARVNLEVDVMARYAARLMASTGASNSQGSTS